MNSRFSFNFNCFPDFYMLVLYFFIKVEVIGQSICTIQEIQKAPNWQLVLSIKYDVLALVNIFLFRFMDLDHYLNIDDTVQSLYLLLYSNQTSTMLTFKMFH